MLGWRGEWQAVARVGGDCRFLVFVGVETARQDVNELAAR